MRVVGQFEKLAQEQYQRLAIRTNRGPLGRRHRASDEPVDKTVPLPP